METTPHPNWAAFAMRFPCSEQDRKEVTEQAILHAEASHPDLDNFGIRHAPGWVEWYWPKLSES